MEEEGLPIGEREFVFPAQNGEPIRRQNFLRRDFYPPLERATLLRIHFHHLRHTAATRLAAAGTPVVQVAQLLGHVDPTITFRTYQHASRIPPATLRNGSVRSSASTSSRPKCERGAR
ncbi:MAG: tyrosine-type recombinase/integrase [Candidatus Eremiobacteraeota bacterium]|nr:tyrosine-type recombinase/integrase [Candidatus Eremiobacteraeota bacterium]